MNQEKKILLCEDSPEGIFTAVYDGWRDGGEDAGLEYVPECLTIMNCLPPFLRLRQTV